MSLGYIAVAIFISVPLLSTRVWFAVGGQASQVRDVLGFHRWLSYLALAYLLVHIIGAIAIDQTIIEYLKPSAPWGMLAALGASVLAVVLVFQSEYRLSLRMPYQRWYRWHCVLSSLVILGMFYHILEANYFTYAAVEKFVLALLSLLAGVMIFAQPKRYRPGADEEKKLDAGQPIMPAWRACLYGSIVAMVLLFIDSIPMSGNRAEKQDLQCLLDEC